VTVSGNGIGAKGATAIAGAIKGLTAMATLDLGGAVWGRWD
jgi:hypothetical protein